MYTVVEKKRPGRPKTVTEINYLRTQYWVYMARNLSKLNTMTELEYLVSEHTFHEREEGGYKYPNVFNKFANGTKPVGKEIVERTDVAVPGSKYFYYHPLWDLLAGNFESLEELHMLLASINSRISNFLFFPAEQPGKLRRRKKSGYPSVATSTLLLAETDLDALAATVGLMHEYRYYGDCISFLYVTARFMIARLAVFTPMSYIVWQLLDHLEHLFRRQIKDIDKNKINEEIAATLVVGRFFLKYAKENNMFKIFCPTHITFIYYLEYYVHSDLSIQIKHLIDSDLYDQIFKHEAINRFFSEMKDWEEEVVKQQNSFYDPKLPPHAVRIDVAPWSTQLMFR